MNRIHEINNLVSKAYSFLLFDHVSGKEALKYLKSRGISIPVAKHFGIGFAPDSWDFTLNFLLKRNFSLEEIERSGLVRFKDSKKYDFFRNRLMFPIYDRTGNVAGFTGRQLIEDKRSGKYINTPETEVFKKSQLIYGLFHPEYPENKIHPAGLRSKGVIITEGTLDVISSWERGIKNVVAPLGTALTESHLIQLKTRTSKIYTAFDNDQAGMKATMRAFKLARDQYMKIFIMNFGLYKDLDEYMNKKKPDPVDMILNIEYPAVYLIKQLERLHTKSSSKSLFDFLNTLCKLAVEMNTTLRGKEGFKMFDGVISAVKYKQIKKDLFNDYHFKKKASKKAFNHTTELLIDRLFYTHQITFLDFLLDYYEQRLKDREQEKNKSEIFYDAYKREIENVEFLSQKKLEFDNKIKDIRKKQFSPPSKTSSINKNNIEDAKRYPIIELARSLGLFINRGNFSRCLFHSEKTASMMLYSDTNTFYCYGCHKSGDVIDLYRKVTGESFVETIRKLTV